MDMDATLFEYDFGSMNVCGVIDDLWMGNANSTDNDLLLWAVQPSRPEQLGNMRSLVVKANGNPDDAVRAISEFYAAEKPELKVNIDTYENIYRQTYTAENRSLKLTGIFALLTIVLTVMAMVAMSTYYARQRARSTAIRKIMGCPRSEIYTHTLVSFLSASLIAAVIAVPLIGPADCGGHSRRDHHVSGRTADEHQSVHSPPQGLERHGNATTAAFYVICCHC